MSLWSAADRFLGPWKSKFLCRVSFRRPWKSAVDRFLDSFGSESVDDSEGDGWLMHNVEHGVEDALKLATSEPKHDVEDDPTLASFAAEQDDEDTDNIGVSEAKQDVEDNDRLGTFETKHDAEETETLATFGAKLHVTC